ncbi:hypothetical protein ACERK3_00140 [Phycisphaerales bacterium AB-hyl4]|uniref:Uncharacterized protein n=1 Tax=Natronomicrosphaera hydrolytica TaxID=3242702 RepID=A0ABV4TZC4_9BACT
MYRFTCFLLAVTIVLWHAPLAAVHAEQRTISVDVEHTQKDLRHAYLGANAQQFRYHYSIQQMLDSGQFGRFMQDIGRPVMRMDGRSVLDGHSSVNAWFSEEAAEQLMIAERKLRFLERHEKTSDLDIDHVQPADYEAIVQQYGIEDAPDDFSREGGDPIWYCPYQWHEFCRENDIPLIGAINDYMYYDPDTGQVIRFKDRPEHFDGAVENFTRKLRWVIDNGYEDLYVAWEIGNETWSAWDPELYAQYARKIIHAGKDLQSDIQLAVPVMIRDTDDPWIKTFISNQPSRERWFTWHEHVLPALGDDIEKLSHLQVHLYGFSSSYSANFDGLEMVSDILADIPNTDHLQYLLTEWRYTGTGGTRHRTFKTGALNNAKFAMTMLSHPRVDYSTAHEFVLTSGLGYWTPGTAGENSSNEGSAWIFQRPEGGGDEYRSADGRPRFDIGPFGPVNRMLNELVIECPELLVHDADLGPMSSALFAEGERDLEWFISANPDRSLIGGVLVNTRKEPMTVRLKAGETPLALKWTEQMTCDPDKLEEPEVPGEEKFWHVQRRDAQGAELSLPPESITSFRATLTTGE